MSNPPYLILVTVSSLRTLAHMAIVTFFPLLLTNKGIPLHPVGTALFGLMFVGPFAQPFVGGLSDRIGRRPFLMLAFLASAVLTSSLPFITGFYPILLISCILGLVFFPIRPVIMAGTTDVVREGLESSTIGFLFTTNTGFSALGLVLMGIGGDLFGLAETFTVTGALLLMPSFLLCWFFPKETGQSKVVA